MSESFFNGFLIGMVFGAFLATVCWDSFTRKVRTIMEPDSKEGEMLPIPKESLEKLNSDPK